MRYRKCFSSDPCERFKNQTKTSESDSKGKIGLSQSCGMTEKRKTLVKLLLMVYRLYITAIRRIHEVGTITCLERS